MKNDKDKMIDNLAKLLVHTTNDAFERASRRAVLICFALKYAFATGIYIALRNFVGAQAGELWMAFVLAYAMYSQELYVNVKIKEGLVKSVLEDHENEKKDTECTNNASDIEEKKS